MNFQTISFEVAKGVAHIELNRPEVRNAFNETMIAELTQAFGQCSTQGAIRAVVLGARGKAFCAGADLNWMKRMAAFTEAENRSDALGLAHMLEALYTVPKPVIARVNGDCYAGGMGLVAACDIAVAVAEANFCLSEVKLGLIPATISPYVLEAIGVSAARRYFLTAERFSAAQARHIGLIHEVVEAGSLDATVAALVAGLLMNSPHAMREAKRLIRDVAGRPIDALLITDTAERIALIRASSEGREGVNAFLEKRNPTWLSDVPGEDN
jgi:methylglutaconyl-CoA hydratase